MALIKWPGQFFLGHKWINYKTIHIKLGLFATINYNKHVKLPRHLCLIAQLFSLQAHRKQELIRYPIIIPGKVLSASPGIVIRFLGIKSKPGENFLSL